MIYAIILILVYIFLFRYIYLYISSTDVSNSNMENQNTEIEVQSKTLINKRGPITQNHSIIPTYPPNIVKYPNFYKYKQEYVITLNPGDALYIPPKWFHWVFSYPDEYKKNIAVSFFIKNTQKFMNEEPTKYLLDKNNCKYLNYSFKTLEKMYPSKKHNVLKSKHNIISPVNKSTLKTQVFRDELTLKEINKQKNKYNIYMCQNSNLKSHELPKCIQAKFPDCHYHSFYWIISFLNDTEYIDSGLHYDTSAGFLVAVNGTKIVRLYHPDNENNFYLEKMYYTK